MRVFYYKDKVGNFGDDLNAWLWREVWPKMPAEDAKDDVLVIGIGTIIGLTLPEGNWQKKVIGSGVGYDAVPVLDKSWDFLAVRGPLSAKALGLPEKVAMTDAAALLRSLPAYAKPPVGRKGVVFMPHLSARLGNWDKVCERAGITYLNPQWDSKLLLEKINGAELVLADAMHAAITADTLRVEWVPLATSSEISTFKWTDWTMSLGMPYRPTYLGASSVVEWLRDKIIRAFGHPHRAPMSLVDEVAAHPERASELLIAHFGRHYQDVGALGRMMAKVRKKLFKYSMLVLKAVRRSPLPYLWRPIDNMMVARAARQLQDAMKAPRYLSDEARLDKAVERLLDAVDQLKRV